MNSITPVFFAPTHVVDDDGNVEEVDDNDSDNPVDSFRMPQPRQRIPLQTAVNLHRQPEYWKDGLPFMFPGAAKLRKQIKAERRKETNGVSKKQRTKQVSNRNKPVTHCPAGTERHNEHYRDRDNNLKYLGFAAYREYLSSDLWERTRSNGFKLKGNQCCLCKLSASILHHHSYEMDVLKGENLLPLFPMCNACHQSLEVKNGKKRPLSLVQANFRKLLKQVNNT